MVMAYQTDGYGTTELTLRGGSDAGSYEILDDMEPCEFLLAPSGQMYRFAEQTLEYGVVFVKSDKPTDWANVELRYG